MRVEQTMLFKDPSQTSQLETERLPDLAEFPCGGTSGTTRVHCSAGLLPPGADLLIFLKSCLSHECGSDCTVGGFAGT